MTPLLLTRPPLRTSLIWQVGLELEAKVSELHEARADLKAARNPELYHLELSRKQVRGDDR